MLLDPNKQPVDLTPEQAQLLRAAPILLEALKRFIAADNCNYSLEAMRHSGFFEQARAAIKAATCQNQELNEEAEWRTR